MMNKHAVKYDVVVIGAGMSGLTAANILQYKGYSVALVEQHNIPGGYCTNFQRKDFVFDSSIHMVNGCEENGMIYNALKQFNAHDKIPFIKLHELFHIESKERNISFSASTDKNYVIEQLCTLFPNDKKGIHLFFKRYYKVYLFMINIKKSKSIGKFLVVIKYFTSFIRFMRIRKLSTTDILMPLISDQLCRDIISLFAGLFGTGPDKLSGALFVVGYFSFFEENAYYPEGGSGNFSQALADIFVANGGNIYLSHEATKIQVSNNICTGLTVKPQKGDSYTIECSAIVSNIDVTNLVNNLLPKIFHLQEFKKRINSRIPGYSIFTVYLGLDLDLKECGFPMYELYTSNLEHCSTEELDKIVQDLSYEKYPVSGIAIYSNVNPNCCPPGKSVVSSVFFSSSARFKDAIAKDGGKRGLNYKLLKEEIGNICLIKIKELLGMPDLEKHIEVLEVATPITFERYTSNREGAFMGWEASSYQMFMDPVTIKTPINNLFFTGQWVSTGGGVSATMDRGSDVVPYVEKYLRKNR